jgi:hypothetical protein
MDLFEEIQTEDQTFKNAKKSHRVSKKQYLNPYKQESNSDISISDLKFDQITLPKDYEFA